MGLRATIWKYGMAKLKEIYVTEEKQQKKKKPQDDWYLG
jgi:hypothetical protein